MIIITLTDGTKSWTTPEAEIPLSIKPVDNTTTVTTLNNDIYTDKFPLKRSGAVTWKNMSKDDYDELFDFYWRQQEVLYQYPNISIPELNINMTAKIEVGARNIVDNCGNVQDVTFSWRESKQNPSP